MSQPKFTHEPCHDRYEGTGRVATGERCPWLRTAQQSGRDKDGGVRGFYRRVDQRDGPAGARRRRAAGPRRVRATCARGGASSSPWATQDSRKAASRLRLGYAVTSRFRVQSPCAVPAPASFLSGLAVVFAMARAGGGGGVVWRRGPGTGVGSVCRGNRVGLRRGPTVLGPGGRPVGGDLFASSSSRGAGTDWVLADGTRDIGGAPGQRVSSFAARSNNGVRYAMTAVAGWRGGGCRLARLPLGARRALIWPGAQQLYKSATRVHGET